MYLLDTNIWLERLLGQDRSGDVGRLLGAMASQNFCITDFSLHSICIILSKLGKADVMRGFVDDVFIHGCVDLVRLDPAEIGDIIAIMARYGLDFDDAYQYQAGAKKDAVLVSFDRDFDKTERGRKMPSDIIAGPADS